MTHIAATVFFLGLLLALALIAQYTLKAYWADIVAALRGELPPRMMDKAEVRASVPTTRTPRRHAAA